MHYGLLSLIPPVLALFLALYTKNIMLALFTGIVSCSIIVNGWGFLPAIFDSYLMEGVGGNVDMFIYMFVFGAFIAAIKKGGGFAAFSDFAEKHFNTPKKSKFLTWLLSGIVVNQSLGTIGVGSIMRPITDRHKISREKLGYLLSTTAEPVTALVPITIYILFFGGMISSIVPGLNGQEEYVKAIPFNFFCIICLVVGLLTALEVIPDFGDMKKREKAARENGELIRPGSSPIETKELDEMQAPEGIKPDFLCFLLPFIAFFAGIIIIRIQTGMFSLGTPILVGFIVSIAYPIIRRYFKFSDVMDLLINGAKSMVPVCLILALAFGFGKSVAAVGFAAYIVEMTQSILTPAILPAVVFVICAVASYATGSLISACVILAPIAVTLAYSVDANLTLTIAALVGGSTFGDCSSPLSDIVIESAMGAGVDVMDLGKAQLLPRLILGVVTVALYLVFGMI